MNESYPESQPTRNSARDLINLGRLASEKGSVTALVALFLPIAILCVGIVVDLGLIYVVQKSVRSACDLGALAGLQELDWEALARGEVLLKEDESKAVAREIIDRNLESVRHLIGNLSVDVEVVNTEDAEPGLSVTADFSARCYFLRWFPGYYYGVPIRVHSEASIVERKKW